MQPHRNSSPAGTKKLFKCHICDRLYRHIEVGDLQQVLWMVAASLVSSMTVVCMKFGTLHFNFAELTCFRGIFEVVWMAAAARLLGISLRTSFPGRQSWRAFLGASTNATFFFSVALLPLATATSLIYLMSIWVTVIVIAGALASRTSTRSEGASSVSGFLVLTIVVGFGGVLLLLQPDMPRGQLFAVFIGLVSSFVCALGNTQVLALSKLGEPTVRIVFYAALASTIMGAIWMLFTGVSTWSWTAATWLALVCLLSTLSHFCQTRAFSGTSNHATVIVVANVQYSVLIFTAILSEWIFGDKISFRGWLGIATIIASGVCATVIRDRKASKVTIRKEESVISLGAPPSPQRVGD